MELEFGDIEGRMADGEVVGYLPNRIAGKEYCDAERSAGCDFLKRLRKRIWRENIKEELSGRYIDLKHL